MVEGTKDAIEVNWFSLDDILPLSGREPRGSTVGDDNPVFDSVVVSGELNEDVSSFCTAGICEQPRIGFSTVPGHVLFKEAFLLIGQPVGLSILSSNVILFVGDTWLSSSFFGLLEYQ
jgi:hypothetical protein